MNTREKINTGDDRSREIYNRKSLIRIITFNEREEGVPEGVNEAGGLLRGVTAQKRGVMREKARLVSGESGGIYYWRKRNETAFTPSLSEITRGVGPARDFFYFFNLFANRNAPTFVF